MEPKVINKFAENPRDKMVNLITYYLQNNDIPSSLTQTENLITNYPDFWQGYAFKAHILYHQNKNNSQTSINLLQNALYLALTCQDFDILYRIYYELAIIYKDLKDKIPCLMYHRLAVEYFNKGETGMLSRVFYGYAASALLFGDYKNGFDYYRYAYIGRETYLRGFPQPFWMGEHCPDSTLFLHNEQAYGDLFFFFRYIKYLKPFFKKIIIESPPRLTRFLKSSPLLLENGEVDSQFEFYTKNMSEGTIKDKPVDIHFDYHTHFALLPRHHGTTQRNIPVKELPIFVAENNLVSKYKKYFEQFEGKYKIAINWCGKHTNEDEPQRRLPYHKFVELAKELGDKVQFFSIQKIYELDKIQSNDAIINLGQHLDNGEDGFVDTAAVMSLVDLVISSDTGIVHVAGGLGIKTWVLIPERPEWRWGLEGEKSIWYPNNFRLFRKNGDNWDNCFHNVLKELEKILS